MKLRRALLLLTLVTAARISAAELPLEFSGVLTDGEKTRFALTDKSSKETTWLELGSEIDGYTVARYEPKDETVTLKKGFEEFPLRLIVAKSPAATDDVVAANATAPATDAATIAIKNNLRQLAVAARQFQLETGAATATFADLVGPEKYIKQLVPVDGENYMGLAFGPGAANLSVTTASGITVTVDTAPSLGTLGHIASQTNATPAADPAAAPGSAATAIAAAPPPSTAPATPSGNPTAATVSATGTPAEAPTPTGPINTSHIVRPGDTLATIAAAAGISEQQLQALNPEMNPSSLKAGQPIRIR